jgi:L,D-peptidoglycan transpeptidase YkuD (ErfK/YbiS/YcfS/YnhG family)
VVVVLGQNDSPVVPGAGSAIFLHLASPDFAPTQGCVALAPSDLAHLLSLARPGDAVRIRRQRRGPQS